MTQVYYPNIIQVFIKLKDVKKIWLSVNYLSFDYEIIYTSIWSFYIFQNALFLKMI